MHIFNCFWHLWCFYICTFVRITISKEKTEIHVSSVSVSVAGFTCDVYCPGLVLRKVWLVGCEDDTASYMDAWLGIYRSSGLLITGLLFRTHSLNSPHCPLRMPQFTHTIFVHVYPQVVCDCHTTHKVVHIGHLHRGVLLIKWTPLNEQAAKRSLDILREELHYPRIKRNNFSQQLSNDLGLQCLP